MRQFSFSLAFLLLSAFCVSLFAQQPNSNLQNGDTASSSSSARSAASPNRRASSSKSIEDKIQAALDSSVDLSFDETPWSEIQEDLALRYGINIVLSASAVDDSLTEDEPVSCNLTGIDLKNALRIMLEQKNATYTVQNQVLMIISLDDSQDLRYFTHSFINVRPLLAKLEILEKDRIGQPRLQNKPQPVANVAPANGAATPNDGAKKSGEVNQAKENIQQAKALELQAASPVPVELITAESLLNDLIHSSVVPGTWARNGSGMASCEIIGGYVVTNSTAKTADQVRDFLEKLTARILED